MNEKTNKCQRLCNQRRSSWKDDIVTHCWATMAFTYITSI